MGHSAPFQKPEAGENHVSRSDHEHQCAKNNVNSCTQNMVSPSDHEYQCAILYAIICHNINQPGTLRVTSSWSSSPSLSSACPGEKTKVAGRGCGSWRWSCWRRRPRRRQPLRWRPWWLGDGMGRMWKGYIYIYIYSIQICIKIAIETWETLGNLDGNKWEKLGVGMIGWVSRCIWASFDSMIWEDGMGNPNSHLMPLKVGNYDKLWQNIGMNMMYNIYNIYTFDVNLHWKQPSFSWRNLEWRQNLGESHRISVILLVQSRSIRYRIVLWLCYIRFCEGYAFPAILSSCWGQKMPKASHKTLRRWPKTSVAVHTSTKTTSPSSMRWLWATSLRAESCVWRKRWVKTMDELATGKVIKRGWLWKSGKSL